MIYVKQIDFDCCKQVFKIYTYNVQEFVEQIK